MDKRTVREFMRHHSCLVEDLRVCANLIQKKQELLAGNLNRYADELAEYDPFLCKKYHSPFKVQTMNEAVRDAVPAWQGQKDWTISPEGDLHHEKMNYDIFSNQLKEKNWILHMMEKGWVDLNSFIPAYFEACRRCGIKQLDIIANY